MTLANNPLLAALTDAQSHETPWPRDPAQNPAAWGVHHDDPAPYNRLRGPVHARGPVSAVVWQHGQEIAAVGDAERADLCFSVAKTFLGLLAGVAQQRGLLPDVDQPVVQRLPGIGFESEHNRSVTWAHLLEQTSEWEGNCTGVPDSVDRWRKVSHDPRPAGGPKGGARPLQTPGSYWEYNDVRINQLSQALLHLFDQALPEVLAEAVMEPLGCSSDWVWRGYDDAWVDLSANADGTPRRAVTVPGGSHWGGGLSIGTRDLARVGQLMLAGGRVGTRQLIAADWLEHMRTPCTLAPFYGRLCWLNGDGQNCPGASAQASFMQGAGGHMVWLEPAHDAVIVVRWLAATHQADFIAAVTATLAADA